MIDHAVLDIIFIVAVALFIVGVIAFAILYRSVRRDVEEALKHADAKRQAEIRKQLVRAMFPPRFPRH